MLVLERTHFGPAHQDRTKCVALSNQRHAKDGAMAPFERELPSQWELSPCALQINYMYGLLVTNGPPHNSCAVKRHRFPASQEAANFADGGPDVHHAVFDDNNVNELRLADAGSVLGNRLENRHYVARRARDHAQNIADRGLLLERFPQLVKQARVLDGDDGLGGEILHQLNLFISERPDFVAIDTKDTDQLILFEQRHSKDGARACVPGKRGVRVLHRQVHELLGAHELIEGGGNARRYVRFPFVEFGKLWRRIVQGDASEPVTFAQCHGAETGLANARGILQRFLEHRPQFAGRRADDAQYIRGGGLLLERFAQLVEQARVLDRDDGLLCKVAHKLNLLVGEGANFLTKDGDSSNQVIILQHRHDNDRANAAKLNGVDDRRNALGIRSCRCKVGGLDRPLGSDQLGKVATRCGMDRTASARLGKCPRHIVAGDDAQCTTFMEIEVAELGLANAHCIGQHRLEHRLQLAGRAADDLKHVGSGGLLLQRLAQLVEKARVLDRDDRLRREVRNQRDLLVGEGANFLTINGDGSNQLVTLEHRHHDISSNATKLDSDDCRWTAFGITLCRRDVDDVDRLLSSNHLGQRARTDRATLACFRKRLEHIVRRDEAKPASLIEIEHAELGLAKPRRVRQDRIEDRPQFARRAADDLKDLGRRRLLLQRLGELLFQRGARFAATADVRSPLRSG